ncbi:unnamed protein product [Arctogadus glacialis]
MTPALSFASVRGDATHLRASPRTTDAEKDTMGHAAAGDHLFSVRTTVVWCLLFCDSNDSFTSPDLFG